jgi:hypothetical protein
MMLGCGDYEIPLRNGYFIARVSSDTWVIVGPDHNVLVGPSVDQYAIKGDVVAGRVRPSDDAAVTYFVLNTRTGTTINIRDEGAWRRELARQHIQDVVLVRPARGQRN